jgi:hypothetical protein
MIAESQIENQKKASLALANTPDERLCSKGRGASRVHRRYMFFTVRNGWPCQFMEEDLKMHLSNACPCATPAKIYQIARRVGLLTA